MAEVDVVDTRAAMLELHFVAGTLAQLGEAEAIEFLGRVPQNRAHVNGMCADHDGVTLRDEVAGGSPEAGRVCNVAGNVDWAIGQHTGDKS